MEEGKKKIKNLLSGLAATSNPFFLVSEALFSEWPKIRKILDKNGNTIYPKLNLFGKGKYDGIELIMLGIFDDKWNIKKEKIDIYKKTKVPFFTFHGCYESFPNTYKGIYLNIAEEESSQIKKAIRSHIEAASVLKAGDNTILVFHPGLVEKEEDRMKGFSRVINNLEDSLELARKNNILICLENMSWGYGSGKASFCNEAEDLKYILDKINHPNLKVVFDLGHLNCYLRNKKFGALYPKNKEGNFDFDHINHFIDVLGKNIAHLHVHYNHSHILKCQNFKKGMVKKELLYLVFWTDISKYLREDQEEYFYDEHLTLNEIENRYLEKYKEMIHNLLEKTSIKDYGFVTHEYNNKDTFKFLNFLSNNRQINYLESLEIFKKMIV